MKTPMIAASAALLTIIACAAPSNAADPLVMSDIEWRATPGKNQPHLRVSHKRSSSDLSLGTARAALAPVGDALRGAAGPVAFTVQHEAGTLACTGTLTRAFEGTGRCRFTSDPGFEAALATRGLAPESSMPRLIRSSIFCWSASSGLAAAGLSGAVSCAKAAGTAVHKGAARRSASKRWRRLVIGRRFPCLVST